MISVIHIHTVLCVHNLLLAVRATNSSFATIVSLDTMSTRVLKPATFAAMERDTTTQSARNKTRDLSYVGHHLIRPRHSTLRATRPTTSSTSRKSRARVGGVRRKPIPSIIRDAKETDSEILRKFTSEQCFVASDGMEKALQSVKDINILGLFALTNASRQRVAGRSEALTANLAVKHVNQMRILGCNYRLNLITNDTKGDPGVAVTEFFHAMFADKNQTIKAVLASSNAKVTGAIARISVAWHLPTVSSGESSSELSDTVKFPMFFRLVAPDTSHNYARIAFLHFFNWTWVMTVCQEKDQYFWSINDLINKLESSNIDSEKPIFFSEQDLDNFLRIVNERETKIIVANFAEKIASKIFCKEAFNFHSAVLHSLAALLMRFTNFTEPSYQRTAYRIKENLGGGARVYEMGLFGGDYIWILPASLRTQWWNATNLPCPKEHILASVEGVIFIGSKKHLEDHERTVSFMSNNEFEKLLPNVRSIYVRETYDAVWSVALALRRTLANCKEWHAELCHRASLRTIVQRNLTSSFQFVRFKGVSGPVLFQGADRICITNFYQIQGGLVFKIAEYNPLIRHLNMNCPRCRKILWPSGYIPVSRRTYELLTVYVMPEAFVVTTVLSVIGILISLCFLTLNIIYREEKYIKMSSPNLNFVFVCGCVLVYTAVIFLGLIESNSGPRWFSFPIICTARITLLSIGCSLAFGSIFAKTYRVHQIFIKSNHGMLKSKVLQDSRLVPILGFFALIDGIIITSWTYFDPLDRHLYNLTLEAGLGHGQPEIIHQLQVEVCDCEHKNVWIFSLSIFKAICIILALYMAWETRNVKIPSLNDSEHIGLTVYAVSITAVLHFMLANVMSEKITLAYLTSSFLILLTTTSSTCLLFLPKIIAIFRNKESIENQIVGANSDLKIESKTIRFIRTEDQEPYYRVHIQNFAYRKYMAFLDKEIQNLHYKLYFQPESKPSTSEQNKPTSASSTKIYDKFSTFGFRREKSSSLCGGMPNLFMLTVLPVVIPRASWPYAEQQVRPTGKEFNFNSESKLQSMRYHSSPTPSSDIPYVEDDDPIPDSSYYRTRWRGRFYSDLSAIIPEDAVLDDDESATSPAKILYEDEYPENSSSDDSDNPNAVLKICKAIVVKNRNVDQKELPCPPKVVVDDVDSEAAAEELSVVEEIMSVNI